MSKELDEIKRKLLTRKKPEKTNLTRGLSSGSTLLNLACSDNPNVCFLPGKYYFLVGDSASGKTFLSLTCLAEASLNKQFDKYRFIYDGPEGGAMMDLERYFGKEVARRLEPPEGTKQDPIYSDTIEDFYYNLDDAAKAKKPFIYILDSMDCLSSEDEDKKFTKNKKAIRKIQKGEEGEVKGSYGDGKAKKNSASLRRMMPILRKTGSILIIISQTRDNIGKFTFETKTRSGGHALRFYATLELWSSIKEKISKTVKGKKRQLGIRCKVQVKKNRLTGKDRSVTIPIYWDRGIDDLESCVDYLIDEGHWQEKDGKINADEFNYFGKKEALALEIIEEGTENKIQELVASTWQEIEAACSGKRKARY